ncbi:MAG TPA: glutaredoxin family protein [Gammaproteobacteria bacterium]|nr:glutaredoxin family protein [Gammaproteobacteria bacterium]
MTAVLTLYSRAGCHLCEAMQQELAARCAGRGVQIEVVDVDSSPELARRYGLRVPVLAGVDGELCYGRLDDDALEDYLGSS